MTDFYAVIPDNFDAIIFWGLWDAVMVLRRPFYGSSRKLQRRRAMPAKNTLQPVAVRPSSCSKTLYRWFVHHALLGGSYFQKSPNSQTYLTAISGVNSC